MNSRLGNWQVDQYRIAYVTMLADTRFNFCWACGRSAQYKDKPRDWYGPWLIERSHIVRSPRVEDVRAVVLLCSLCHKAGVHGERIITADRQGEQWPELTIAHLMWLKRQRDRVYYEPKFLQQHTIKKLPPIHKPPRKYLAEYELRRGVLVPA